MKSLHAFFCLTLFFLAANTARAVSFGSLADWAAEPDQTISIDDKNFVWLADSGNWDGSENVNLAYLPSVDAHALGIETLEGYQGPLALSFSYRIDITSSNVFAAVGMDQDFLFPSVTTYKDIYFSVEAFEAGAVGPPGNGTVTLSITDFTPSPPPPVFLPPVQSIWVRDTIVIDNAGSVQSISNTFIQEVPEPRSLAIATSGIGIFQIGRWWRRRGQRSVQ